MIPWQSPYLYQNPNYFEAKIMFIPVIVHELISLWNLWISHYSKVQYCQTVVTGLQGIPFYFTNKCWQYYTTPLKADYNKTGILKSKLTHG